MKKIISALIISLFVFSIAACGNDIDNSASSTSSSGITIIDNQSKVSASKSASSSQASSLSQVSSKISSKSKSSSYTSSKPADIEPSDDILLMIVNKQNNMPENFNIDLKTIKSPYAASKNVNAIMFDDMMAMLKKASQDGYNLYINSAYRSVETQERVYNRYINQYISKGYSKEDAIQIVGTFSAKPNQSEHSTGLAADMTKKSDPYLSESFEKTAEFKWLQKHAADYGFIMRYPKDKTDITGYKYEPWHYRYVGRKHAKKIKELNTCLEEYVQWLKDDH